MDELFEIIFEMILEGTVGLAKSRRVPLPLRILAAVLITALYGGVVFLIVFAGLACFNSGGRVRGVLLFITAAVITGALIWQLIKAVRRHNNGG